MRLEGLRLRNFRCYDTAEVAWDPGVTVVHGVNGSGKSSLLDACFFALYGSDTLHNATLDEVITTGAERAEVSLTFWHDGTSYEIERELRLRDDQAHTATCELRSPDEHVSGARAVREAVARMLRMDAEAFLNCAYVRQGEVNKLIHATPGERQDMLDELLQLGVLEDYRDRATGARRAAASLLEERDGQLDEITGQIAKKEAKGLTDRLNELETKRKECEGALEDLAERVEAAEATREAAKEIVEQYAERQAELEQLEEEIETLREAIASSEGERASCTDRIAELAEERTTVEDRIGSSHERLGVEEHTHEAASQALERGRETDEEHRTAIEEARVTLQRHEQTAEQAKARATELADRATELESEVDEREAAIETDASSLAERREELAELRAQRDAVVETISERDATPETVSEEAERYEAELAELRDRESDLRARINALEARIEETESLVEAGKCPTCEQPVDEAPPVESLTADREQLAELRAERAELEAQRESKADAADQLAELARELERLDERIATVTELIDEKEDALADRREEVAATREEIATVREEATSARSTAEEAQEQADAIRGRIADHNERREELAETIEDLESLVSLYERLEELEGELERLRECRDGIDELNDERRERLAEKRERRRELTEAVDPDRVEAARADLEQATADLEAAAERRERLETTRDDLLDRIGRVQNELEELATLEERREAVEAQRAAIETVHGDVEELESMYAGLRGELRERNLAALERMLNETFALVYQNDAYDRIDLDRDYRFTVYQKDGEPLDPDQLSGGERALFNLSLRCAIYRLLSEGIEGAGPLPPLILDEPTVYLDEGHVGRLVELVDAMRSLGVEQIILVTHDRELLRAADVTLTVEKDPTSNRSSVRAVPVSGGLPAQD